MARALRLEQLESRDVPAFLTDAQLVVGADALSPPLVRLIDPTTQAVESQFLAFDPNFFGGVRVAVGDVTGDGHRDLVVAAGPSGGPVVKVYDGQTGAVVSTYFAYAPSFTGGVNVAVADVNGDGRDEVITGAGGGGGPQVMVFDGATGGEKGAFFAYDAAVRGGVRVAGGDLDGDGKAEIVTGPGFGGGPDVRAFRLHSRNDARAVTGFFALDPTFTSGLYVAAGDLTGDGKAEIVVGAGAGGGPQVGVFAADGSRLSTYFAYSTEFRGGVRVGVADLTGDGVGDVVTAPGPTGAAQINVYPGTSATAATALFGFPTDQKMGAFVTGSPQRLAIPSTPQQTIDASYAALEGFKQAVQPPLPPPPTQPGVVIVPVSGFSYYPWWAFPGYGLGLGYGFGFGLGFYDAPGLYAPYGIPYSAAAPIAAGYYSDPFGAGYGMPVSVDPGYYGGGYVDSGYYDPSGYTVDYGYSDVGYSDFGGYYDPGFYYSDF
ncbi:MAG TPA: VCBS repeat-containing protein [Fimbriiglobus sp.]|nr:VCBS repeat-containing protein [Fimbriiglobus sp.]